MTSDPAIRLYFVTGRDTLVSRVIRGAELGFPYSHVGAFLPDGRVVSAHARDGVHVRRIEDEAPWAARADVFIPCTATQRDNHGAWLLSQVGKPYDLVAIGAMLLGLFRGRPAASGWPSAWICSALQFEALAHPDVGLFPWRPTTIRTFTPEMVMVACMGINGSRMVIE